MCKYTCFLERLRLSIHAWPHCPLTSWPPISFKAVFVGLSVHLHEKLFARIGHAPVLCLPCQCVTHSCKAYTFKNNGEKLEELLSNLGLGPKAV